MVRVECMTRRADRILLVLPSLDRGGAERVLLQLARSFRADGREVHVAVLSGGGPLRAEVPDGVVVHELVVAGHPTRGFALARSAFPRLVSLMRSLRPHAVLSTMTGTNLLTILATRLSRRHARIFVREASSLINAPHRLTRRAMRLFYPGADMVIAVSRGVADDLSGLGIPNECIRVIHNPVDTERLRDQAVVAHGAPCTIEEPYLIAIGRLTEAKDYPTLLRAYAASTLKSDHRLVVVGEGVLRGMLEVMARELGIASRVLFTGALDNPFRLLANASLLVLSSKWEGYPNVLLESLALGVPVVSTDCRHGPRELLDHGRHGRLVPVGDPNALARAMEAELEAPSYAAGHIVDAHDSKAIASRYLSLMDGRQEGFPS